MARTAITPQAVTPAGFAVTYEAANVDGHSVTLGPIRVLHVKNASAAAVTVTLPTPGTVGGLAIDERAISVPAGGDRFALLDEVLRQPDGTALINLSAVASVTLAVLTF